uniref:VWFA domain-containing protein n=1 Tax=Oryza glumipatula TaxID=40148 RepID=A0A0E0BQ62_9ORYZ
MSEDGKAMAKRAVDALVAHGNTNIRDGLDVAAKVLDGRRHTNAVASVILLSDGQDNETMGYRGRFHTTDYKAAATSYDALVPPSFARAGAAGGERCAPVHAFGFGTDHDAAAMHSISEITGGTFSFIENLAVIQDTFARCIGGLLSVAAQKTRISVECLDPGVRVRAVKSGRYESRIDAEGRAATVDVGELYADEERRFLLLLDVPRADGDAAAATRLASVRCTYRDTATGQSVDVAGEEDAVVLRPLDATGVAPSMEVERERVRLEAADDIALASAAPTARRRGSSTRGGRR